MRLLSTVLIGALALFAQVGLLAGPAEARDDSLVRKQSPYSVAETLDRLTGIVESKGATVFARVNHAGGAEKVGETLRPTELLIFGNPKIGTPLMTGAQEAGLDLPLRVLAYEDADGQVWLAYRDPITLVKTHHIADRDEAAMKMRGAIDGLTNAAVAQ